MKTEKRIYHLCNLSPKVIFRNEEDFMIAISRLAACAYDTETEVWAYAFMSTHFHLIVNTAAIDAFIKMFKINISMWHNKKYLKKINVSVGKRSLESYKEILTAVNYVLKNPIHHKIVDIAFRYPYSSAHLYFRNQIDREDYFEGEKAVRKVLSPDKLSYRTKRKIFASHNVPPEYKVLDNRMILPESFVRLDRVHNLYQSARSFMYNMSKALKEEIIMFRNDRESINSTESSVSLFGKLTDMELCAFVDNYLYPKTYAMIGVSRHQFERLI